MFDSRRDPCAQEKIFIVFQLKIGVNLFKQKLEIKLYFLSDILHSKKTDMSNGRLTKYLVIFFKDITDFAL